jgi:hypothetical protein
LAPYENAPERYFTSKNFFWPAELKALLQYQGAKLVLYYFRNDELRVVHLFSNTLTINTTP